MKETIDARGLDCPKPVLKTKEVLDRGCSSVQVRVDNEVAAANVTRFLEGQGFSAERLGAVPDIAISGERGFSTADKPLDGAASEGGAAAMLLLSDRIGADSDGLGDVLMKAFLGTVAQSGELPSAIALMNEGVKLALPDRSTCDTLRGLEEKGVKLLICGTCTKHFGITGKIEVGVISNMFEITEAIFAAGRHTVIG